MKYIATISGGKDSVTMCDLLLKNGHQVDEIIFADTLLEFDEMYEYIEKLKKYFKDRYDKDITVLTPKSTFEVWCLGTITKGDRKGQIRGIPTVDGMCYWRREAKVRLVERYLKDKYPKDKKTVYLGYTVEEDRSATAEVSNLVYEYPLKDKFKYRESDCIQYLAMQEMENVLYRFFTRLGCFLCPFQSEKSWYELWLNFPKLWKILVDIEYTLYEFEMMGKTVINKHWFSSHRTCEDMEAIFKEKKKQGNLFDFSDEPLKDCFCKI